jgi:outer membrane protein assembly factor BamB
METATLANRRGFMKPRKLLLIAAWFVLSTLQAGSADWPSFRGPHSSGVSEDKDLPTTWSEKENLVWKTALPGPGGSSPIIIGDRIFLTCWSGYFLPGEGAGDEKKLKRHLVCLDRKKGTILWDKDVAAVLPEAKLDRNGSLNGYASSTPVSDGERVYVFFGKTGVLAFDFEGKQLWQTSVGTGRNNWGSASSPVLYKDLVIVNASVESQSLVALNKKDGKEAWKCPDIGRAWNSPVLVDVKDGKQELVIRVTKSILGIDPATGNKLWHCDGFRDGYVCPTVVARDGVVYSLGGRFQGANVAVKAGGEGDVKTIWSTTMGGGSISSPALHGDLLYWVHDGGTAHCVKTKNGEKVYSERLKNTGTIYASLTIAGDKMYAVSRNKGTFVLAAGPEFKQLGHNTFEDDKSIFNGSPAVSKGQLFLRSDKYLYCIGKK